MKSDKTVFGIIGLGAIAQRQHLPNISRSTKIRIKTVSDLNPDLVTKIKGQYEIPEGEIDYAKLLKDPEIEAVLIAVREKDQAKIAIDSLRAGKYVYVEKPLASTPEECQSVANAAAASGKLAAVGFNRRFAPAYLKAKELVDKNGGAKLINYRFSDEHWLWGAHTEPDRLAGMRMHFELCHIFDIFRWFTASDPESVYCITSRPDEDIVTLKMKNGAICNLIHTSYATRDMPKERLEVIAGKGGVTVEEFVELRTYGDLDFAPVYNFQGHANSLYDYSHKWLFEKLGSEALYAFRRTRFELQERIRANLSNGVKLPWESGVSSKDMENLYQEESDDRDLILKYLYDRSAPLPYMVNKGWLESVEALADAARGIANVNIANANDGYMANITAHAAMQSRETGKIVNI